MRTKFTNINFDIVMVMDAILISLACVLVIMAYREVSGAPVRTARETASILMVATDNLSKDDDLLSNSIDSDGIMQFQSRIKAMSDRIGGLGIGGRVQDLLGSSELCQRVRGAQ